MDIRPKKLANKFMISANTLRNYEAKGLIPPAERSANGYRMYTERHEAYLACIQALAPGFGMEVTTIVLHGLQRNELDDALWIVREREVMLHREKASLDQLVRELNSYADGSQAYDLNQCFSIHEVSRRTGVPKSAIRYWEKSGLFTTERDPDNGYRLYNEAHLLKIKMIQVLQSSVYSEETVNLKQSIALLEFKNIEHAMKLAESIRTYLHKTIKLQMRGLYFLYRLIQSLGFLETTETHR
ncbi:MerR family transcriptional regulator [Paenibacillus dokdonensis]|uniref:MerR family transcriptional regulator n=1 Tax=Paenibacillus dokdonensis TaxID=2567944 RepID=A0ABU6GZI5_9BACL|nr:MerR family transcriptional regulator [Paenibacillus dokdonensis]MEC0243592.1 MerR family transcriptional regulator [Paenibacillus dokdonensis]